jgi:hypothetical protein
MKLIKNIKTTFSAFLGRIGQFLNQTPTVEELKKVQKPNLADNPLEKEERFPKREKFKRHKEVYEHTGSSYKGKGKVNTDSATYNRARKDIPVGREH